MGLYRALTMDTYRLLQKDIRVGLDQNQKEHLDRPKVLGKERRCDSDTPRAPEKDHWYSSSIMGCKGKTRNSLPRPTLCGSFCSGDTL